jgi:hypothetical protein
VGFVTVSERRSISFISCILPLEKGLGKDSQCMDMRQ